jgi:hypothetical protein
MMARIGSSKKSFPEFVLRSPHSDQEAASASPVADEKSGSIEGLELLSGFVSESEQKDLLGLVESWPWSSLMSRRVQQYGYAYNYYSALSAMQETAPIPKELNFLLARNLPPAIQSRNAVVVL